MAGALSTLISYFFMRFVLVLLICHQVGHDSNLASAVINAGASLQRAIFSSQGCCWELALAKNALEWFHRRYCLWWNLRTSCLSSGQLIVLTRIPCDLSSLPPALRWLWQACYQCLMAGSEGGVGDSSSLTADSLGNAEIAGRTLAFVMFDFFLCHPVSCSPPRCCRPPWELSAPQLRPSLGSAQQHFKHLPDLSGFLYCWALFCCTSLLR